MNDFLLIALGAYLLGSIPFAILTTKAFGLADPRTFGSGNPGATNVLRTGNKLAAALTLLGDAAKGLVAILLVRYFTPGFTSLEAIAGIAAFAGHVFPVFLRFQGGKGVATALGVLLGASPWLGLGALGIWLCVAFTTRYSSLSALSAAVGAPALAWLLLNSPQWTAVSIAMAAMLIYRHKTNIQRLLRGEESKMGKKS